MEKPEFVNATEAAKLLGTGGRVSRVGMKKHGINTVFRDPHKGCLFFKNDILELKEKLAKEEIKGTKASNHKPPMAIVLEKITRMERWLKDLCVNLGIETE